MQHCLHKSIQNLLPPFGTALDQCRVLQFQICATSDLATILPNLQPAVLLGKILSLRPQLFRNDPPAEKRDKLFPSVMFALSGLTLVNLYSLQSRARTVAVSLFQYILHTICISIQGTVTVSFVIVLFIYNLQIYSMTCGCNFVLVLFAYNLYICSTNCKHCFICLLTSTMHVVVLIYPYYYK